MPLIPRKFFNPTQLGVAAGTLYTVPSSPPNIKAILKKLTFTNTTNATVTVTVYLVASGGSAADSNTLRKTHAIEPLGVYEAFEGENHILEAGDFIQALASAATSITAMGSGFEAS